MKRSGSLKSGSSSSNPFNTYKDDFFSGKEPQIFAEDISNVLNFEDDFKKKRSDSPNEKYSKQRILTRLKTYIPPHNDLSNILRTKSNEQKSEESSERHSVGLGKNYVLKQENKKIKVLTPSAVPRGNPLLDYFNNAEKTPEKRQSNSNLFNMDGSDLFINQNNNLLDDIKFPFNTSSQIQIGNEPNMNVQNNNMNIDMNINNSNYCEYGDGDYNMNIFLNKNQKGKHTAMFTKDNDAYSEEQKGILNYDHQNILQCSNNNNQKQINNVTINNNYINHYNITQQSRQMDSFHSNQAVQNNLLMKDFVSANNISSFQSSNHKHNDNVNGNENATNKLPNNYLLHPKDLSYKNNSTTGNPSLNKENKKEKTREMARDQNGCRCLQKMLESEPEMGNEIFDSLEKDLLTLSCGSFGNYLIQKLLSVIDPSRLNRFVDIILPFFVQISVSAHGTRVIQKLIDSIQNNCDLILKLNLVITQKLLELTTDPNSSHVIQKYVSVVKYPLNNPIYETISKNFLIIAKNKYGCCMMQRSIECGTQEQSNSLIYLSLQHSKYLITDQYGNYVLQYIIQTKNVEFIQHIVSLILTNIPKYCKQKFSSNVIEKCLEYSQPELQGLLINLIAQNENLVSELLVDPFGNYIIQKILQIAKGKIYYNLLTIISNHVDALTKVSFGSRLLSKLVNTHKDLEFLIKNRNNQQMSLQHQQQQQHQQMMFPNYNNCFQGYNQVLPNYNEYNNFNEYNGRNYY